MRLRLRALDIKPIKIYVLFFAILHVFIVTPAVNAQFIGPDITKTNGSVVVNITIEETIKGQTYGPEAVVLKFDNWANTAGGETTISISPSKVAPPADRTVDTSPPIPSPSKNNESITISAELPDVIPAKYKACLVSIPAKCTGVITVESGGTASGNILITKAESQSLASVADASTKTSCGIPGIGWIICPVFNFMAYIADASFQFLANNFLVTSPSIVSTDSDTYTAWTSMRSIANVAFVIVFLIIIFSQVSSFGVSNYGIKKMLPRLVIAAILVNVSFFICQIAVDISNILGYSINNLLVGLIPEQLKDIGAFSQGNPISNIVGSVLIVAAGTTVFWASLAMLGPVLLAAVVALMMILFILVARQAIIILLVVISPLAFVAFLLPNTSDLFKKWQKTFTAMLMLFPIIALVFGGSKLASGILSGVFYNESEAMGSIIAAAVLVVPLFIVPGLLKKSLDVIPALGQYANKFSGMANSRLSNKANEAWKDTAFSRGMEARKQYKQSFRSQDYARRLSEGGITGLAARGITGNIKFRRGQTPGLTKADQFANEQLSSYAVSAADKIFEERVSAESSTMKELSSDDIKAIARDNSLPEARRVAAIKNVMNSGNLIDRSEMYTLSSTAGKKASAVLRDGFYSRGDNKIFGSAYGDMSIRAEKVSSQNDLDLQLIKQIESGDIAPAVLKDEKLVNRILAIRSGVDDKNNPVSVIDSNGNPVKIQPTGISKISGSAKELLTSPVLSGDLSATLRDKLSRL